MPYVIDRSTGQTKTTSNGPAKKKPAKTTKKKKGAANDMSDAQQKMLLVGLAAVIVIALLFTGWYLFGSRGTAGNPVQPISRVDGTAGADKNMAGPVMPPPAGLNTQPAPSGPPMMRPGGNTGFSRPMQSEQPASTDTSADSDNGIH